MTPPRDPRSAEQEAVLVAETLASLADALVDDYDVVDLMERLMRTAVELCGASAAGLLLVDLRGGLQVVASSSEQVRLLELFQLQNEQGPCLDCISTGVPVVVPDLASTDRWPRFVAEAVSIGYSSVVAVPMRLRSQVIGGLNLFRVAGEPMPERQQRVALALADIATIGIVQQRSAHRAGLLAEQLQQALTSRIVVEQAKGVLTEQGQVPVEDAYSALRRYARDHGLALSRAAELVVRGELDHATLLAARSD